jgi:hypothetical protein
MQRRRRGCRHRIFIVFNEPTTPAAAAFLPSQATRFNHVPHLIANRSNHDKSIHLVAALEVRHNIGTGPKHGVRMRLKERHRGGAADAACRMPAKPWRWRSGCSPVRSRE